ncbi:Hippurate hydrolase [Balamuthia mandrillaris]
MSLERVVESLKDTLVEVRRDIHQHPETAFKEVRTSGVVLSYLQSVGLPDEPGTWKKCAGTGLVVDIKGTAPPKGDEQQVKMIALRSDLDALPMTEENFDLPYRSVNEGAAHMCGHDGHISMLLGAATLLLQSRDKIPSDVTIRLLFQPAEEGPGGAPVMIEEGCLEGVEEVYGIHNWPTMALGEMRTKEGPLMAHVSDLYITIRGKGGHGSQPQTTKDPIVAAAHVVTALQTIVSRNVHYEDRVVISITTIHGGETHNVIPDTVEMSGTIRDLSDKTFALLEKRINSIVKNTCEALDCEAQVKIHSRYPVLINTPNESEHVIRVGKKLLGEENVSSKELPMLGAEDFAFFLQKVPGCFFFLGGGEQGRSNNICHSSSFEFNDNLLPIGVKFWIRLVEDRLNLSLFE